MKKIYILPLVIFISSCATRLNYLGSSSTPTDSVDVFVDASAIKRPYTIIGRGYQESSLVSKERLQEQAVMKAKEKGADAVLFEDYFLTRNETNTYTIAKTDSSGRELKAQPGKAASAVVNSQISILFLKYN